MKCGVQLSVHLLGILRSQFLGPWGLRPEYSVRSVTRVNKYRGLLFYFFLTVQQTGCFQKILLAGPATLLPVSLLMTIWWVTKSEY